LKLNVTASYLGYLELAVFLSFSNSNSETILKQALLTCYPATKLSSTKIINSWDRASLDMKIIEMNVKLEPKFYFYVLWILSKFACIDTCKEQLSLTDVGIYKSAVQHT
jgi:hypothetical protein